MDMTAGLTARLEQRHHRLRSFAGDEARHGINSNRLFCDESPGELYWLYNLPLHRHFRAAIQRTSWNLGARREIRLTDYCRRQAMFIIRLFIGGVHAAGACDKIITGGIDAG